MQGSPGGGREGLDRGGPGLGSRGTWGLQTWAAEAEVHPCYFACHVPSWLSTKACHPPVSFSGAAVEKAPRGRETGCSAPCWRTRAMLSGNEAERARKASKPLQAFNWPSTRFVFLSCRMSEGDSVGDSVHGKPSVVYRFFTRLGQVGLSRVRWVNI